MANTSRPVFILLCFISVFIYREAEAAGKQNSAPLQALCSATRKCKDAYEKQCQNGSQPVAANVVPVRFCEAIISRLAGAEDIPETDQQTRINVLRNHNYQRSQNENLCDFLTSQVGADHVQSVVRSLDRGINYLGQVKEMKYSLAVVATRNIQAQTALYLEHAASHTSLVEQLRNLALRSKTVSFELEKRFERKWTSIDHMIRATYFSKSPEWNAWKEMSVLDSKEIYSVPEFEHVIGSHYDHSRNDECFLDMIRDCGLSQECAEFLLEPSNNRSTLIHNAMFFRMAIKLECVEEVDFRDKFPNGDWQSVLEDHCAKMWNEANIISNADFPVGYRSLFLEHSAISGFLGYPNFLRSDWMNQIIEWMNSSVIGCIPPDTKDRIGRADSKADDRAENGEWCSYYETALGIEILTLHLRYLLEMQQQCPV